ncbi:MAG: hypothetical protein AB8G16_12750 [Gammaproteobacteria bacterium]
MKTKSLLAIAGLGAVLFAPMATADDAQRGVTGSRIKQLPAISVQDPTAEKKLVNADNSDLDAELQAILAEVEAAESAAE